MKKIKEKMPVIVAIIGLVGTISAAIIGAKWGKENINVMVQIDGKNVILDDSAVQDVVSENEDLQAKITDYEKQIENLQSQSEDLANKLGAANGELSDVPAIEFQDCGLSVDGDEKVVDKNKSYVTINGRQYYSKDFVDNLLPSDMSATMKDGMLYIGKIIKSKENLLNKPIIDNNNGGTIQQGISDTYGNTYSNALYFILNNLSTTFNVGREYSDFKCTVAQIEGSDGIGILQIETDEGNVIYTSPKITNLTEPFEIDIPINQTSKLTIRSVGDNLSSGIFIANAIVYNQE